MKRFAGAMVIGTALLAGCGDNNPPSDPHADAQRMTVASAGDKSVLPAVPVAPATPGSAARSAGGLDDVVAKINGEPMTLRQLVDPLIESRGLTMLVNLVELEVAKQNAAQAHIVVTEKDFEDERDRTLEKMFKESDDAKLLAALDKAVAARDADGEAKIQAEIKLEREDYLTQFLANQHVDRVEFDIVLHINAHLRKILEKEWKDKITDADVRAAFGQMYGEKVKISYILLTNTNEVGLALRRLKDGDTFEQVAKDMSHDPATAPIGGELPAFSREAVKVPQVIKDAAFSLRDGQVSDPVVVQSSFYLIKRVRLIPPQAVSFEDVVEKDADGKVLRTKKGMKDLVYRTLYDKLMDAGLKGMKQQLGVEARRQMSIVNPVLKRQFDENVVRQAKANEKAKEELDRQQRMQDLLKLHPTTNPADTQPATGAAPATTDAATQAAPAATGERPPATEPGTVHSFQLPRLGPDTEPTVLPEANK